MSRPSWLFVGLTFAAALLIEGLGTAVSVIGLSSLFGSNPVIIALAVALDLGKLVVVSMLYTYWARLGVLMRGYALAACAVTMVITSAGAAGYLSGEFQRAILGTQEVGLRVEVLRQEQVKLEARKRQIDDGIAAIPDRYSANQKIRLINQFKEEQRQVTARLLELSRQLPDLQLQQIGVEAKAGPILYVAKAFEVPVEVAVRHVILAIIFVFDPLAVFLIVAGNFLLGLRTRPTTLEAPAPAVEAPSPAVTTGPQAPPVGPGDCAEPDWPEPIEDHVLPIAKDDVLHLEDEGPVSREEIRMSDLRPPRGSDVATSQLHGVRADDSVTFEANPPSSTVKGYGNLR